MEATELARVQFDTSTERLAELDALIEATGLRTRRELFDNALALFEWAVEESRRGRSIASINEETNRYQPIMMPALRNAAKHHSHGSARRALVSEAGNDLHRG